MIEPFFLDLERQGLFDPRLDRVLLAVSGGRDSSLLAHFCHQIGLKFGIAHVNFQLRGHESDDDEAFVEKMAERFQVPFFLKKEDAKAFSIKHKCSVQEAARQIRYVFFEKIRSENNFRYTTTGHHLADNFETALLNFVRGTGLRGLRGMRPIQNHVIRPFLEIETARLHDEAARLQLEWRNDRSNDSDDYSRNFLRHRVVPLLEKINPSFASDVAVRNFSRLRETEQFVDFFMEKIKLEAVQVVENQTVISLSVLEKYPSAHFILKEILRPFGFQESQVLEIWKTKNESGNQFFSEKNRLVVDRNRLFIGPKTISTTHFLIEKEVSRFQFSGGELHFSFKNDWPEANFSQKNSTIAFLKTESVRWPLRLRHWSAGDRFQPLGMAGRSKKLQDFFTDQKLALPEKERVWLLENHDGDILWLLGLRLDERAAATEPNDAAWRIEWLPPEAQLIENE